MINYLIKFSKITLLFFITLIGSINAQLVIDDYKSCNQGYTPSGEFKTSYQIDLLNTGTTPITNVQVINELEATMGDGCITQIDLTRIGTVQANPDVGDPRNFWTADFDEAEFNAGDPTPGADGILDQNASNILYPGQKIEIVYCVHTDPDCVPQSPGTYDGGSSGGVDIRSDISLSSSNGSGTESITTHDYHETQTFVAGGIHLPNETPTINVDGTFDFSANVVVTNEGAFTATGVQFYFTWWNFFDRGLDPFNTVAITQTGGTPTVTVNSSYDPTGTTEPQVQLFDAPITLSAGETVYLELDFNVGPISVDEVHAWITYSGESQTQGNGDHYNENAQWQRWVEWTDSEGNHLDRFYETDSPTDLPSAEDQCNCSSPEMEVIKSTPTLNLVKDRISMVKNGPNFDITYHLTASNNASSEVQLENLVIQDDLAAICGASHVISVTEPTIFSSNATTDPTINTGFNGVGDIDLLDGSSGILEPGQQIVLEFVLTMHDPCDSENVATFDATDPSDDPVPQDEDDAPLPVELADFNAIATMTGVQLDWRTESEIENLGFTLERKTEDSNWKEIASYKTKDDLLGQGTVSYATDYSFTDKLVEVGETYEYRLADVDYNGIVTYHAIREVTVEQIPLSSNIKEFTVLPAYPNPFNPSTTIRYAIPLNEMKPPSKVLIEIYGINGRIVHTLLNGYQSQGWHSVVWNGTNQHGEQVPAGIYFSRVSSGNNIKTNKLLLLR